MGGVFVCLGGGGGGLLLEGITRGLISQHEKKKEKENRTRPVLEQQMKL